MPGVVKGPSTLYDKVFEQHIVRTPQITHSTEGTDEKLYVG